MKAEDWSALSVLYQTKNLTQAAKRLYISQPALTIRLQNIERDLGCQIAIRSNRGLFFTPEGEYLAKQAIKITELIDQSLRQIKTLQGQNLGIIKLIAPNTFFRYFLLDLLQEYKQVSPATQFQVESVDSSEVAKKIAALEAYGGFVHGDYYDSLPKFQVASMPAYAVSKKPITLEDLATLPLVAHSTTAKTQNLIQEWWKTQFNAKMDVQMSVKNIDLCLQMVENGFGAGIVFGNFFKKNHALCTLPLFRSDGSPLTRDIWFLYAEEFASTPCMQAFIEYLHARVPLCAPDQNKGAAPAFPR